MKTEEEYNAEVLQLMRDLYPTLKGEERKRAERLFPELKESEDEKISKEIITWMKGAMGSTIAINRDKWIAWLEKQGETFTKKDVDDAYLKGICDVKHELKKQDKEKSIPNWIPKFLDELRSKKNYFDWDEHRDIEGSILAITK